MACLYSSSGDGRKGCNPGVCVGTFGSYNARAPIDTLSVVIHILGLIKFTFSSSLSHEYFRVNILGLIL